MWFKVYGSLFSLNRDYSYSPESRKKTHGETSHCSCLPVKQHITNTVWSVANWKVKHVLHRWMHVYTTIRHENRIQSQENRRDSITRTRTFAYIHREDMKIHEWEEITELGEEAGSCERKGIKIHLIPNHWKKTDLFFIWFFLKIFNFEKWPDTLPITCACPT